MHRSCLTLCCHRPGSCGVRNIEQQTTILRNCAVHSYFNLWGVCGCPPKKKLECQSYVIVMLLNKDNRQRLCEAWRSLSDVCVSDPFFFYISVPVTSVAVPTYLQYHYYCFFCCDFTIGQRQTSPTVSMFIVYILQVWKFCSSQFFGDFSPSGDFSKCTSYYLYSTES